uniref:30S ribosomal protein S17, chloroplastic n=1 Tax=Tetradesmus obliquus TaxID=3088 RepID=A0A383W9C0_TETOB|eukprot:jgi/Sobl393_1/3252/SZX73772.1
MGGSRFVGRVVSNRMQKTVVVAVDYVVWRPKIKAYEKRTSKHFAHDERQKCDIGDTVRIKSTKRLSKHKSYAVEEILRKVNVYSPEFGAQQVAAAEAAAAAGSRSRVDIAEEQHKQAQERLLQLHSLRAEYNQHQAAAELAGGSSSSSSSTSNSTSQGS